MKKLSNEAKYSLVKGLGLVVLLVGLGILEYTAYQDTTEFLSNQFVSIIQEDNSFFQ